VTETIVVPDDYLTIQDAINNAPEGAIIFVKKGTYSGPVNETIVINKTISLVGEDPQSTILNLYPAWICKFDASNFPFYEYDWALNVQADDVELSNFTINSIGVDEGAYMLINGNNTQLIDNILNLKLVLKGSNEIIVQNNLTVGLVGYDSFVTSQKTPSSDI
jgi:pectin methylesterase-like acyl-CoA thioesterase